MGIDLTIPGDPAAIRSLAEWLDPKLNNPVNDLHQRVKTTSFMSWDYWRGETATAFRETTDAIAKGIDPVDSYIADAAEVFRAYSERLRRGKEKFAEYGESAKNTWLTVVGPIIAPPIAPQQFFTKPGSPPPIQRGPNGECIVQRPPGAYEESLELYKKIANDVGTWWGDLENWVDEHIVLLMTRVEEFQKLTNAFAALQKGNYVALSFLLNRTAAQWEGNLTFFEGEAKKTQGLYESHNQRLRSGDPRIRSAAEKMSKPELRAARHALASEVGKLKVGTKIIPLVGPAIDVVSGGVEIANGGSPSTVVVGVASGVGGGVVAGAVITGTVVAAPVVVTAVAVTAASVAAAEGSRWLWEHGVSLDVREAIDSGDFGYIIR